MVAFKPWSHYFDGAADYLFMVACQKCQKRLTDGLSDLAFARVCLSDQFFRSARVLHVKLLPTFVDVPRRRRPTMRRDDFMTTSERASIR